MGLVEMAIPVRDDAIQARGHFDHSLNDRADEVSGSETVARANASGQY